MMSENDSRRKSKRVGTKTARMKDYEESKKHDSSDEDVDDEVIIQMGAPQRSKQGVDVGDTASVVEKLKDLSLNDNSSDRDIENEEGKVKSAGEDTVDVVDIEEIISDVVVSNHEVTEILSVPEQEVGFKDTESTTMDVENSSHNSSNTEEHTDTIMGRYSESILEEVRVCNNCSECDVLRQHCIDMDTALIELKDHNCQLKSKLMARDEMVKKLEETLNTCDNCKDMEILKDNCIDMEMTTKKTKEYILELKDDVENKIEKITLLEENLAYFLDENAQLKNKAKQEKGTILFDSVSSESDGVLNFSQQKLAKDGETRSEHAVDDLGTLRDDYMEFKKFICKEIATLKEGTIQYDDLQHEEEEIVDNIQNNNIDEDWKHVEYRKKKMQKSKSDTDLFQIKLSNRFKELSVDVLKDKPITPKKDSIEKEPLLIVKGREQVGQKAKNPVSNEIVGGDNITENQLAETIEALTSAIETINTQATDNQRKLRREWETFQQQIQCETAVPKRSTHSLPPTTNFTSNASNCHSNTLRFNSNNTLRLNSNNTLRFNSNNLKTTEGSPNELGTRNDILPVPVIRPGRGSYKDAVTDSGNNAMVISTSMTKGIDTNKFREDYNGKVTFHRFHGKKARHIKHYIPTHLSEEQPDIVIIQAGGNDLANNASNLLDIANNIMEIGQICKRYGASKICISSVLPREDFHYQLRRKDLNELLKNLCVVHDYAFMENSNIILSKHICGDGVHLDVRGSSVFSANLLESLNFLPT